MSATERNPYAVRQARARELDVAIASAEGELERLQADVALVRRGVDRALRGKRPGEIGHFFAGIVMLPVVVLAALLALSPWLAILDVFR